MKNLTFSLFAAAMALAPLVSAQARVETKAQHEAWIKAQKIDIPPTLKITETVVPAGSAGNAPAAQAPANTMPSTGKTLPSPDKMPAAK